MIAADPVETKSVRVDPRVLRTRQLLQQAFYELMAEKDFHNITVQDIAARARVNRATFYAHFEDKYALLNYVVRDSLETTLAQRLPAKAAFTLANLTILSTTIYEFLGQFFGHCVQFSPDDEQLLIAAQVQKHLSIIIQKWIECSEQQAQPSVQDAVPAMSWVIFGGAFEWARGNRKVPPEKAAQRNLAFIAPSFEPFLALDGS